MVTVIDFKTKSTINGKVFNVLVLQGDVEMVQSQSTGRYYATARTCNISCTFNDVICQGLIGKTLPGTIERMETEPYEFTVPESGEVLTLTHAWYYNPTERTMEQEVFSMKAA
jgi:hypothetical protein